jgi:hypothetical protein
MRTLFILLICLNLLSCASDNYYQQALNSWRGNDLNNLFKVWGAPDQVIAVPSDNTYYIYHFQSLQSARGPYVPSFVTYNGTNSNNKPVVGTIMLPSPPNWYVLSCRTWFLVNKSNIIVDVGAKGNYCYASDDNIRAIASPSYQIPTKSN